MSKDYLQVGDKVKVKDDVVFLYESRLNKADYDRFINTIHTITKCERRSSDQVICIDFIPQATQSGSLWGYHFEKVDSATFILSCE